MERNQAETNRRLQDVKKSNINVMKSNMGLKRMLKSIMSTLSGSQKEGSEPSSSQDRVQSARVSKYDGEDTHSEEDEDYRPGCSEYWWNQLEKTSEEEDDNNDNVMLPSTSKSVAEC
ncbi:hypothetical protein M758_UG278700 [Ceratodon purpureus]|nr:hypothetical protein M758_UG278700 [Ceratodon purpureus]